MKLREWTAAWFHWFHWDDVQQVTPVGAANREKSVLYRVEVRGKPRPVLILQVRKQTCDVLMMSSSAMQSEDASQRWLRGDSREDGTQSWIRCNWPVEVSLKCWLPDWEAPQISKDVLMKAMAKLPREVSDNYAVLRLSALRGQR